MQKLLVLTSACRKQKWSSVCRWLLQTRRNWTRLDRGIWEDFYLWKDVCKSTLVLCYKVMVRESQACPKQVDHLSRWIVVSMDNSIASSVDTVSGFSPKIRCAKVVGHSWQCWLQLLWHRSSTRAPLHFTLRGLLLYDKYVHYVDVTWLQ